MKPEAEAQWTACLADLERLLPEEFQRWIAPLHFGSIEEEKVTLVAPSRMFVEYVDEHYSRQLLGVLRSHFGSGIRLGYRMEERPSNAAPRTPSTTTIPAVDSHLNDQFSFATFVEGKSNKMARTIALTISKKPGQTAFSPFFIFGPSGVGKTHLTNAIGLEIKRRFSERRVLFVAANEFKRQYGDAVKNGKANDFMAFYQSIDVLLIDDIQELTTPRSQQTFFHVFNYLQQQRGQLVITCDRSPAQFEGFEERVVSRFKAGITAEMERPDVDLRRRVLMAKIKRDGLKFPADVIDFIVTNVSDSVRDLEGVVNSLMAYSVAYDQDIDIALARRVVARAVVLDKKKLTFDDIIAAVGSITGVRPKDILSSSRRQEITEARQISMYLCRKHLGIPATAIGSRFGGKDHSTVLHACRKVERLIGVDKAYRQKLEEVECLLSK